MSASSPRVALVFGSECIEVDGVLAERRGGLRAFAREAESKWGLQPNSFSFVGSSGKLTSAPALQHEVQASSDEVCKIEVHEKPEAKIMREVHVAVMASEERILAKLEASLAHVRNDLEQTDNQVANVLAPMVQCMALKHMQLDTKVTDVLAPMVQCMALEQMQLRDGLAQGLALRDGQAQELALDQMQLRARMCELETGQLDAKSCEEKIAGVENAVKSLEAVEKELQHECALQAACDLQQSAQEDLDALQMEVCSLGQSPKPSAYGTSTVPSQEECEQNAQVPISEQTKHSGSCLDVESAWFPQPPVAFAYSSKAVAPPPALPFEAKWRREMWSGLHSRGDDFVAFPQGVSASRLGSASRTWGSRSMPVLPPLQ